MLQKPVYIGNDHGGYKLKQSIMEHLKKREIAYVDIGSGTEEIRTMQQKLPAQCQGGKRTEEYLYVRPESV